MSGSSSYTVSARLQITGNYAQVLTKLGRGLTALDAQIKGTQQELVKLAALFPRFAQVAIKSSTAAAKSVSGVQKSVSGTSKAFQSATRAAGAFNVGAQRLARTLGTLDRQVMTTERHVVRMAGLFPRVAQVITTSSSAAAGAMGQVRTAAAGMSAASQGVTRAVNSQAAAMGRNATAASRMAASATAAAQAMRSLANAPTPGVMPTQPGGRQAPGRQAGTTATGGRRREREGRFSSHFSDPTPFETYFAGRAVARGIGGIFSTAGEVQTMETLQRAQQIPPEVMSRVREAAPQWIAQAPGTTVADAMQAFNEAVAAVGDEGGTNFGPAMQIAPLLLRAARVSALVGGRDTREGLRPLARFLAIRGSFTDAQGELNPRQGANELRAIESALIGFSTSQGEGIDPREWALFAKRMGIGGRRVSIEAIIGPLASLIQEVGGESAGTQLTAFFDQIVGNTRYKQTTARMKSLGLIRPTEPAALQRTLAEEISIIDRLEQEGRLQPGEAQEARVRTRQILPKGVDAVVGRGLAAVRPDLAIQAVHSPRIAAALQRDKRRGAGPVSEDEVIEQIEGLGIRQTDRRFYMSMLQEREVRSDISRIERIEAARRRGEDPAGMFVRESFAGALGNVTASFTVLLQELGRSEGVVGLLNRVAEGLTRLANAVRDNPGFMDKVVADLQIFLDKTEQSVEEFRRIVAAVDGLIQWLQSKYTAVASAVTNFMAAVDAWVSYMDALPGRVWGFIRRSFGFGGEETAPGASPAPAPGAGGSTWTPPAFSDPSGSGFQLNSFQPHTGQGGEVVVQTALNLDGRLLTEVVTRHQGRAVNAPVQSPSFADRRRGMVGGEVVSV